MLGILFNEIERIIHINEISVYDAGRENCKTPDVWYNVYMNMWNI